jgi:hypothetical protein
MMDKLFLIIESINSPIPHFPPTLIYNEGWLLRLVIDWFSQKNLFPILWYSKRSRSGFLNPCFQAHLHHVTGEIS